MDLIQPLHPVSPSSVGWDTLPAPSGPDTPWDDAFQVLVADACASPVTNQPLILAPPLPAAALPTAVPGASGDATASDGFPSAAPARMDVVLSPGLTQGGREQDPPEADTGAPAQDTRVAQGTDGRIASDFRAAPCDRSIVESAAPLPAAKAVTLPSEPDWQPFRPARHTQPGVQAAVATCADPPSDPDTALPGPEPDVPGTPAASVPPGGNEYPPGGAPAVETAAGAEVWRLRLRRLAERCEVRPVSLSAAPVVEPDKHFVDPGHEPPLPRGILSSLRPLARLVAESEATTDLVLTSEELGPLRFRIRSVAGGGLSLHVEAALASTLSYLRGHAGDLAAVLADLGLSGARLTWGRLSAEADDSRQDAEGSAAEIALSVLPSSLAADALDILL